MRVKKKKKNRTWYEIFDDFMKVKDIETIDDDNLSVKEKLAIEVIIQALNGDKRCMDIILDRTAGKPSSQMEGEVKDTEIKVSFFDSDDK